MRARSGRPARSARRRGGSTSRTPVYDAFSEQLLARIERGKVGDPLDPDVEVGPIVNETQFDEILAAIERGKRARAAPCSPAASAPTTTAT